jgi:hypothetical protein
LQFNESKIVKNWIFKNELDINNDIYILLKQINEKFTLKENIKLIFSDKNNNINDNELLSLIK